MDRGMRSERHCADRSTDSVEREWFALPDRRFDDPALRVLDSDRSSIHGMSLCCGRASCLVPSLAVLCATDRRQSLRPGFGERRIGTRNRRRVRFLELDRGRVVRAAQLAQRCRSSTSTAHVRCRSREPFGSSLRVSVQTGTDARLRIGIHGCLGGPGTRVTSVSCVGVCRLSDDSSTLETLAFSVWRYGLTDVYRMSNGCLTGAERTCLRCHIFGVHQ